MADTPDHLQEIQRQSADCLTNERFWRKERMKYERGSYCESGDPTRKECAAIANLFADLATRILTYERSL